MFQVSLRAFEVAGVKLETERIKCAVLFKPSIRMRFDQAGRNTKVSMRLREVAKLRFLSGDNFMKPRGEMRIACTDNMPTDFSQHWSDGVPTLPF
jgi:hypothetical protein